MGSRSLHASLLGGFEARVDDRAVPAGAWRQRRAASLVQMLACAPAHRLAREQVIEALWPRLPPAAGAANLRKAAHHARRALGVDSGVVLDAGMVQLLPGGQVSTDVERFEACAQDARERAAVDACRDAAALYRGSCCPLSAMPPGVRSGGGSCGPPTSPS